MKELNLIKQINQLKKVKSDAAWKAGNREILIKQIYGSQVEPETSKSNWVFYFKLPLVMVRDISQPTLAAILIFIFLVSGGFASVKMADNTKPGDPFYIAKLISEKTQLALTFGNKEKALLGMEFANNRVAEINQVLAESATPGNNQKVENLLDNLKSQISDVKSSIAKINYATTPATNQTNFNNADENNDGADQTVFSANLKKESNGIEISDEKAASVQTTTNGKEEQPPAVPATTTEKTSSAATATTSTAVMNMAQTSDILKEAEQLLNENKYSDTLTKLNEVDSSISPSSGDDKSATTTAK